TPQAKKERLTVRDFEAAMHRLRTAGKIDIVQYGRPSDPRYRVVLVEDNPSVAVSVAVGVAVPATPVPPHASGLLSPYRGDNHDPPPQQRPGSPTATPNRDANSGKCDAEGLPPGAELVGPAGPGERCWHCGKAGKGVLLIRRQPGEEPSQMHADCARQAWTMLPDEPVE